MSTNQTQKTIYLKDYQAPQFSVESVELNFVINPESTTVSNKMQFRRTSETAANQPLRLEGRQLTLLKIILNNLELNQSQYQIDSDSLTISQLPEEFTLEIITEINPVKNTSLEGLYASGSMVCTQCEPHGFSRITYFLDRPDVLTNFTTRIEADKNQFPLLASNGNLTEQGDLPDNRHFVIWEDPFIKPAYLFALVAGRLVTLRDSFTTCSGRKIAIHFHIEEQNREKCAHAINSLKKAMRWDEEEYGREYDLDLYQVVAVDDFNFGAMENKGLNIFNSKYVLAKSDSATDADYEAIEGVIAHEYLHNWTGNRITCRDWFQLSLKEGLTVFRDQQYGAFAYPGGGGRIRNVRRLRNFQFPEDAGPLAHPVQPKEYVEINNFYTTTVYEKGAEIIRMLWVLLGVTDFRKGMDLYFVRHDGAAVTIEDLLQAMSDASGRNLEQFKRWYDQAGTPELSVKQSWNPATSEFILDISQRSPATPGQAENLPLHIPLAMALLDRNGNELDLKLADDTAAETAVSNHSDNCVLEIKQRRQRFRFRDISEKPTISLLRGFSAPVKLECNYDKTELAFIAAYDNDAFSRWEAGQKLALIEITDEIDNRGDLCKNSGSLFSQTFGAVITKNWPADEADGVAEMLTLPGEIYIGEQLAEIDPQKIFSARQKLKKNLARKWRNELESLYHKSQVSKPYQPIPQDMARRRLQNLALDFLAALGTEGPGRELCRKQYQTADNLTNRVAALTGLLEISPVESPPELIDFYSKSESTPLLLDRWFALQALVQHPETGNRVKKLTRHPAFIRTNPNRVRSLLATFALANQAAFHHEDGSGYRLLGHEIATLDQTNPQLAARLAGFMSRWQRFASPYRELMQNELQILADHSQTSKDLGEIVNKSLMTI